MTAGQRPEQFIWVPLRSPDSDVNFWQHMVGSVVGSTIELCKLNWRCKWRTRRGRLGAVLLESHSHVHYRNNISSVHRLTKSGTGQRHRGVLEDEFVVDRWVDRQNVPDTGASTLRDDDWRLGKPLAMVGQQQTTAGSTTDVPASLIVYCVSCVRFICFDYWIGILTTD